jgi:transposase-like protein
VLEKVALMAELMVCKSAIQQSRHNEPEQFKHLHCQYNTDKLRSYPVAHGEVIPEAIHATDRYANNRLEQSHELTRTRERGLRGSAFRRFKLVKQTRRFLAAHAAISKSFYLGRHLVRAEHSRDLKGVRSKSGQTRNGEKLL